MAIAEPTEVQVDEIIDRWQCRRSFVIEMLQDLQQLARYLPEPAIERISKRTGVPMAQLYHIHTINKAFSLEPRGEHIVHECLGTACHVNAPPR